MSARKLHGEDLALVERGNDVRFKVDGKDFVVALHKKFQCFETDTAVCAGQNDFFTGNHNFAPYYFNNNIIAQCRKNEKRFEKRNCRGALISRKIV